MKAEREIKKTEKISADLNFEDYELLEKIMLDNQLSSRREGFAFLFKSYRQSLNPTAIKIENTVCRYLFGAFCCKDEEKIKETTPAYCAACMQAEKIAAESREENLSLALEIWQQLTGQRGFINRSLGLVQIQSLVAQKNEDLLLVKEDASVCPKCGFEILRERLPLLYEELEEFEAKMRSKGCWK